VVNVQGYKQEHKGKQRALVGDVPAYENRWASYNTLPGAFNPAGKSKSTKQPKVKEVIATTELESPATQVMPDLANDAPKTKEAAQHRPLLDLFEAELSKLMRFQEVRGPHLPESNTSKESLQRIHASQPPSSPAAPPISLPTLFETSLFTPMDARNTPSQTPGEVIARSVKMLLEGVGSLATTVTTAHSELQQHISGGTRSNNLDRAFQASTAAIDALRGIVPIRTRDTSELPVEMPQSPAGHPTSAETTSCEATTVEDNLLTTTEGSPAPLSNTSMDPNGLYRVEKIVNRRFVTYDCLEGPSFKQYLVHWHGFSSEDDVWYDDRNLDFCRTLVEDFEHVYPEMTMVDLYRSGKEDIMHDVGKIHFETSKHPMRTYDVENGDHHKNDENLGDEQEPLCKRYELVEMLRKIRLGSVTLKDLEKVLRQCQNKRKDGNVDTWDFNGLPSQSSNIERLGPSDGRDRYLDYGDLGPFLDSYGLASQDNGQSKSSGVKKDYMDSFDFDRFLSQASDLEAGSSLAAGGYVEAGNDFSAQSPFVKPKGGVQITAAGGRVMQGNGAPASFTFLPKPASPPPGTGKVGYDSSAWFTFPSKLVSPPQSTVVRPVYPWYETPSLEKLNDSIDRMERKWADKDNAKLKHRVSWHPESSKTGAKPQQRFSFEPATIMARYPPIAEFERDSSFSARLNKKLENGQRIMARANSVAEDNAERIKQAMKKSGELRRSMSLMAPGRGSQGTQDAVPEKQTRRLGMAWEHSIPIHRNRNALLQLKTQNQGQGSRAFQNSHQDPIAETVAKTTTPQLKISGLRDAVVNSSDKDLKHISVRQDSSQGLPTTSDVTGWEEFSSWYGPELLKPKDSLERSADLDVHDAAEASAPQATVLQAQAMSAKKNPQRNPSHQGSSRKFVDPWDAWGSKGSSHGRHAGAGTAMGMTATQPTVPGASEAAMKSSDNDSQSTLPYPISYWESRDRSRGLRGSAYYVDLCKKGLPKEKLLHPLEDTVAQETAQRSTTFDNAEAAKKSSDKDWAWDFAHSRDLDKEYPSSLHKPGKLNKLSAGKRKGATSTAGLKLTIPQPRVSFAHEPAVQYLINAGDLSSSSKKDNYSEKPLDARANRRGSMEAESYDAASQMDAECIQQLQELGYTNDDDGKLRSLVRSVDGDLHQVIDAIEEDRSAWSVYRLGK